MPSPGAAAASTAQSESRAPTTISHPRRLLILSPSIHSPQTIPPFLHALTEVPVEGPPVRIDPTSSSDEGNGKAAPTTSYAGYTTHAPLRLQTKYYTADIPIWVDEVPYSIRTETCTRADPTTTTSGGGNTGAETLRSAEQGPPQDQDGDKEQEQEQEQEQNQEQGKTGIEPTTPSDWTREFLGPEARVVRDAVGALVVAMPAAEMTATAEHADRLMEMLQAVGEVRDQIEEERGGGLGSGSGDVPGVVVLVGKDDRSQRTGPGSESGSGSGMSWLEDELLGSGVLGWEVVAWDPAVKTDDVKGKKNQYGECEGLERLREVLEANEWAASSGDDDFLFGEDAEPLLDPDADDGFQMEVNELEREMLGLRMAIETGTEGREVAVDSENGHQPDAGDENEELQVEELQGLMLKMQAIKDMSADLPEAERKKFAMKAVQDIMKSM